MTTTEMRFRLNLYGGPIYSISADTMGLYVVRHSPMLRRENVQIKTVSNYYFTRLMCRIHSNTCAKTNNIVGTDGGGGGAKISTLRAITNEKNVHRSSSYCARRVHRVGTCPVFGARVFIVRTIQMYCCRYPNSNRDLLGTHFFGHRKNNINT
jgi:hypothetical protein